jgi:hypothetical protein
MLTPKAHTLLSQQSIYQLMAMIIAKYSSFQIVLHNFIFSVVEPLNKKFINLVCL